MADKSKMMLNLQHHVRNLQFRNHEVALWNRQQLLTFRRLIKYDVCTWQDYVWSPDVNIQGSSTRGSVENSWHTTRWLGHFNVVRRASIPSSIGLCKHLRDISLSAGSRASDLTSWKISMSQTNGRSSAQICIYKESRKTLLYIYCLTTGYLVFIYFKESKYFTSSSWAMVGSRVCVSSLSALRGSSLLYIWPRNVPRDSRVSTGELQVCPAY